MEKLHDQPDEPQGDLRRELREYIESLKPEWHAALTELRQEQDVGSPTQPSHRPDRA